MKTKHLIFSFLAVFAFTSVLIINACKKDVVSEPIKQSTQISQEDLEASKAMSEHIKAFKERMEYYKDHPDLKGGGDCYIADDAVLEMESLLNFDLCYTNIETDQKVLISSEVIMPLNELNKINDPDLTQVYYDAVVSEIQSGIDDLNYSNPVLLLVDLKYAGDNNNGDAIVGITAVVGNQQVITLHDDNWWYGELHGLCNGTLAPQDGAQQLEARVTNVMLPPPPQGNRWYFINPQPRVIPPTQDLAGGVIDNYMDYKVFYATEAVGNIGYEQKCMSRDEMDFYEGHYIDYAVDCELDYNKKFYQCIIRGNEYNSPAPKHIQHDYKIWVANRYYIAE